MKNYVRKAYVVGFKAGITHVQVPIPLPKGVSHDRAVRTINTFFDGYRDAYLGTNPRFRIKGVPLWNQHRKQGSKLAS